VCRRKRPQQRPHSARRATLSSPGVSATRKAWLTQVIALRARWEPPFGDTAWPDDTRIEFLPPEDGFLLDEECRKTREKEAEDLYRHSYATFDPDSCVWRPN